MGRANERIARIQETYVINSTNSWLESLERSLAQMKEYQVWPYPPLLAEATNRGSRLQERSLKAVD